MEGAEGGVSLTHPCCVVGINHCSFAKGDGIQTQPEMRRARSFIEGRADRDCPCLKKTAVPGSKERNTGGVGGGVAGAES